MADSVLVVQNGPVDPPGRLVDWLAEAGLGLDLTRPFAGEPLPAGVADHRALVVLGGAMNVHDDYPWLDGVRALLREAVGTGLPTLGICLGAQLLADAAGGRVATGADGPELGPALVAKRDRAGTDALFGPVPLAPDVLQWHYDVVSELPAGAELLASSTRYPHQAFRVGAAAWGLQFHIETTPAMVAALAEHDQLAEQGVDVDRLLARYEAVDADIALVWAPLVERFAALARR